MALVTTAEGICNLALDRLGHQPITTIGESTKAGLLANRHYEATRDALLQSHPWNFAIKYVELAQDATETTTIDALDYEFDYAYALPTNPFCLKVIRTDVEAAGLDHDYRIVRRFLYSNEDTVKIEYIGRVTTVTEYSALFMQVLALMLAARWCMPLTDNASLYATIQDEVTKLLTEARLVDAQEGAARDFVDQSGWVNARL